MCGALEYRLSTTLPFPKAQEDLTPWGTIQRKLLKQTCSKSYLHFHWQKSWNSTNSPSSTEDKGTQNRLVRPPHAHPGSPRPFIHTLCKKKKTPERYLQHDGGGDQNTQAPTKAFISGYNWNRTRRIHRQENRGADNVKAESWEKVQHSH